MANIINHVNTEPFYDDNVDIGSLTKRFKAGYFIKIAKLQEVHSRNLTMANSSDVDKAEMVYNAITDTIDFNFV